MAYAYPVPSPSTNKYHLSQPDVLRWAILPYIRAPALAVGATLVLEPLYRAWTRAFYEHTAWMELSPVTQDAVFFALGSGLARAGLFVVMNTFFFLARERGWLHQIRRRPAQIPSPQLVRSTLKELPFDLLFFTPGAALVGWPVFVYVGGSPAPREALPSSPLVMYAQYMWCFVVFEVGFYASHWLLHHNVWLYKNVHKIHHAYTGTISVAADASHPIENLLSATLPIVAGPILCGAHPLVFFVHVVWRLGQSYEEHAGLSFYGTLPHRLGLTHADNGAFHDCHHRENTGNLGTGTLWLDVLFGTVSPYWYRVHGAPGYVFEKD